MELLQLKYFLVVADIQHMTHAAEKLNITQPALSTVISRLEYELGVPLFDRVGRSIVLNSYGEAFQRRGNQILMEIEDSKRELKDMAKKSDLIVSLSVTSPQFLQGMAEFIRVEPDIKWQQRVDEVKDIIPLLERGQIDLAITSPGLFDEMFHSTVLLKDEFMIAVHPDHPLAARESVCLQDIAHEKFIMLQKGLPFRTQSDLLLSDLGIRPNIIMECDHYLRRELINANAGITIASSSAQFRHLYDPQIRFLHIEDARRTRDIVMTRRKDKYLSTAARKFAEFLMNNYRQYSLGQIL